MGVRRARSRFFQSFAFAKADGGNAPAGDLLWLNNTQEGGDEIFAGG